DDEYTWHTDAKLPRPLAYGVSITTDFGLICIGGSDSQRAYRSVLLLRWEDGGVKTVALPDLPGQRANAAGALVDGTIYLAGGQTGSKEEEVTNTFWSLKLPTKAGTAFDWQSLKWEEVPTWPGPSRAQAVAAAQGGKFYLFSGFDLEPGPDGKPKRKYLSDAYCFDPKKKDDPQTHGWTRIADVPHPVVAAPAIAEGDSHVFVFGGHDGTKTELVEKLKDKWPGFNREILAYHTITGRWVTLGEMPVGLVTTNAVRWQQQIVIPGGEVRPRLRSNVLYRYQPPERKKEFGPLNTAVLGGYLLALVGMGIYFARREKTTADFFIGGRRVPWWAAGISIFGTQLSAISFMAIPAKVYATDWLYFVGIIMIVAVQPIVRYVYLPFFRRLDVTSAYEYLEKRFNLAARMFGSASFILFQLGRMAIVLFLPALALSAVTGMDIYLCILAMGVLATAYTALGGIEAVVWTDVLQVFVLVGGALLSLGIILWKVDGGFSGIVEVAAADGKFHWAQWGWDYAGPVLWVIVVGGLFQHMISYTADQAVVQRYLTTKDEKAAAGAIWTNAALIIPVSLIWFFLGTALYVFYKARPELLDPALETDQTFPLFIAQQLPDGLVGLVIAGLFAAAMSTIDSSLNSISTACVTDFFRRFHPAAADRTCLRLARWLTVVLGLAATGTALILAGFRDDIESLWDTYMAVLGLLMGSLTGLFALGMLTRRTHARGALIGAVAGVVILFCVQRYTDVFFYLYAAVGIVGCFAVGYLASLILPGRGKDLSGLTVHG
ncbi:MAG TPA: sodium/solute symporter, partial [Thermoguttaceae bacterium]|nr:sodium/solute symporter [Thermoguttaceae bacterium]